MFAHIDCAPMEGVTRAVFRRRHHRMFGGADRYFTPFLSPSADGVFSEKELREVLPEACRGVPTVPQLLAGRAEHFVWAAKDMAALGYREVNLNLGCPSGTVVAKHKGSGLLADPGELDRFLEGVFSGLRDTEIAVSVKTRTGLEDSGGFSRLMEVFNRYPICVLTIHPRAGKQFYRGEPDREAFALGLEAAAMPVCYNGDVFTLRDARDLREWFPKLERVMLGRGLVADPSLARQLRGGPPLSGEELRQFHDGLLADYLACIRGEVNVLHKMKELWNYWGCLFPQERRALKAIRKAPRLAEYRRAAESLLQRDPAPDGGYSPELL